MACRVLSILPEGFEGSMLWRTWFPSDALKRHGYTADYVPFENYNSTVLPLLTSGQYDVVITPRFIFREGWMLRAFERTIRSQRLTWLYDLDDDTLSDAIIARNIEYWMQQNVETDVPKEQHQQYFQVGNEYEVHMRQQLLELVDGVIVSRTQLKGVVDRYTDAPVRVIENAIDPDWFTSRMHGRTILPFTIGWSGSWRNDSDLEMVGAAWSQLAKKYPHIHFVINGYVSPSLVMAVPSNRLHVLPWVDIQDYPSQLQNIDIGCCSVANTEWNLCKSPIKWFEMTLAGSPCVVSNPLYGEYVSSTVDGLIASDTESYVNQLSRLIEDPCLRESITKEAQKTVLEKYNIEHNYMQWVNTIQELKDIDYGYL